MFERMNHQFILPVIPAFLALFSCLAMAETSPAQTGVEGVITMSPTHGGPIKQGEPDSKPMPNTAFVVRQGDQTIASFETDAQGRFKIPLAPGHYEIVPKDQTRKFPRIGPFPVDVAAGEMKTVRWDCDSGLR